MGFLFLFLLFLHWLDQYSLLHAQQRCCSCGCWGVYVLCPLVSIRKDGDLFVVVRLVHVVCYFICRSYCWLCCCYYYRHHFHRYRPLVEVAEVFACISLIMVTFNSSTPLLVLFGVFPQHNLLIVKNLLHGSQWSK
jgi:hypothetical protein